MYATPVPTFANRSETQSRKKDKLTVGPRVKQALPPITNAQDSDKKRMLSSQALASLLNGKTQDIFTEASQHTQVYMTEIRNIEERLANRTQIDDDSVQLAIRAADNDTRKALEAASFFRDEAAGARQQTEMLMQRVATLERDNESLNKRIEKSNNMLNSIALDLYSDISSKTIDRDMLLTQYSRIRLLVSDCNHISAEIGFPSTSVPEIVELLDPQTLQNATGNTIMVEGAPRSIQSVALSLTLAECQILRSLNFLLKHLISGHKKLIAQESSNAQIALEMGGEKTLDEEGKEHAAGAAVSGTHGDPIMEDIVRQAMLVSPLMTQTQLQNPNDVFRVEFQGSGVAVAKALVELRRRTASFLLREARFDHDPLLKRTATDNTTLRTLVAALQNELHFTRQALEMVKGLGLSSDIFPFENQCSTDESSNKMGDTDLQSSLDGDCQTRIWTSGMPGSAKFTIPNFSSAEVIKLAESALTSAVDLELLPSEFTKRLDDIVESALTACEDVDRAKETQHYSSEERVSVTEIQRLIMLREKALQHIDEAAQELLATLDNSQDVQNFVNGPDQGSAGLKILSAFDNATFSEPSSLLSFAKDANDGQTKLLARFSKEQSVFMEDLKKISRNLTEGHVEKYSKDGSGFQDVLYRHASLLEHTLEMHKVVVARNMALARLQVIIVTLQKNHNKSMRETAYLAALRNGILKGYLEQSRRLVVLKQENDNFRSQIVRASAGDPDGRGDKLDTLLTTITDAAIAGNKEYCTSLASCVKSLTEGYRTKIAECKAELCMFGNTLASTSSKITEILEGYRVMIETKACKLVQTDRKRRTFDTAVMTEEVDSGTAAAAAATKKK